ncbi:ocellar opsin-like [Oculina patagonica]
MYCHVRFSQSRETSSTIAVYAFLGLSSVVLAILTVFGNSLILRALRTCQSLDSPTKALFCSLAFSDLAVGIVVYPLFATYCFASVFNSNEVFCAIRGPYTIAAYCLGSVSFFTMTAISLDRFYSFTLRLRYHQFVTLKRVVFILSVCWIFGFVWPFSFQLKEQIPRIVSAVIIFCCVATSSISYIKITMGIRRHQRQIQEHQMISAPQHGGAHFCISQYKKSLNTMILVFCLLLACYLPFFAVLSLNLVTGSNSRYTNLALNITSAVIKLNSLLNPLVYCWRMRELRREVMNALPCFAF